MVDPLSRPAARLLAEAAGDLGLSGDGVEVEARDFLPSRFAVTDLAVASIGAVGVALADMLADGAAVTVDAHLASAWFRYSLAPVSWSLPNLWDAIAGDYRAADGWVRLHTNAPRHRQAALRTLGCAGEPQAVEKAVSGWTGEALEDAVFAAGGCAAFLRSGEAWAAHPQGRAVAAEPLIALRRAGDFSRRTWRPEPARPLRGIRVLDLTRVLAGPVATRTLAGLGADVLRIDPPDWDEPAVVPDVTLGKRCARLDLASGEGRRTLSGLLAGADVLVHGYRPGALEGLGFGEAERRRLNPGLIDISLCAWGWDGPWAGRRGFDSLVQMAAGIAEAGRVWKGVDRPLPLPVQALDHATGYLLAAAALRGLWLRSTDGAGVTAKLSLARTAASLVDAGEPEEGQPFSGAGAADYASEIEPTSWGQARRLRSPLRVGETTLRWRLPAVALGTSPASWAP